MYTVYYIILPTLGILTISAHCKLQICANQTRHIQNYLYIIITII